MRQSASGVLGAELQAAGLSRLYFSYSCPNVSLLLSLGGPPTALGASTRNIKRKGSFLALPHHMK